MGRYAKTIGLIIGTLLLFFVIWYFSNLVVYILIAAVLSFIGHPLVDLLDNVRIGKFRLPHSVNAGITLLAITIIIALFFLIFVPVISRQSQIISSIDFNFLGDKIENYLQNVEGSLTEYKILSSGQTLEKMISEELEGLINMTSAQTIFRNVLGFAGTFFLGIFSVIFLTFFFLRDKNLFRRIIIAFVPTDLEGKANSILSDTRKLLSRYFIGLSIEVATMITLLSVILWVAGIENALLIGFLGGLMNIIPYLGPIIGTTIGVILGVAGGLSMEMYDDVPSISLIIMGTFAIANLIDNFVLQPLIYSTSVHAHPVEIFLVIMMAGSLAGVPGMILAIPAYTVIRIVAKQFLGNIKIVKQLTKDI